MTCADNSILITVFNANMLTIDQIGMLVIRFFRNSFGTVKIYSKILNTDML